MELIKNRLAELTAKMSEAQLSSLARVAGIIVNGPDLSGATPIKDLTNAEDILQATCFQWHNKHFRRCSFLFSVPLGGTRHILEAKKLQATGARKGVSDLILLAPGGKSYYIEMKAGKGKQEPEQMLFQAFVERLGFEYFLIWSFADFKTLIFKLLAEFVDVNKNYV